jgi:hypothetical protein
VVISDLRPDPEPTRPRCPALAVRLCLLLWALVLRPPPVLIKPPPRLLRFSFSPTSSYTAPPLDLQTLAAPPAAPASCAPPPSSFVRPLRCSRWVRRGPCFTLVPPASQIVPGSAGSTCAGEVAIERRRLRRVRRRPSAHRCSRPSVFRSVVQIALSRGVNWHCADQQIC